MGGAGGVAILIRPIRTRCEHMFAMAHASYIREKTRAMRVERQLTIDELAERMALSRSTIYYWVRDLPIPSSDSRGKWPESARRKGTKAMQRKVSAAAGGGVSGGTAGVRGACERPDFSGLRVPLSRGGI